jgi:hypothetical protein
MGRTLTNNTSLAYAIQQSFGVLGASPAWKLLEPNSISQFVPTITTVPRGPISPSRQRRKGTITDLDSSVEFEADLTLDSWLDFVEGFIFAQATNHRLASGALRQAVAADATLPILTTEGYSFSALASAIPVGALVFTRGFDVNAVNNGLKEVTASNTTEVEVDGGASGILDEDPGNTGFATLETAGFRFTDLAWDDTAKTLTSATVDPSTIGLTPGQLIYVGGLTATEQFTNGTAWARVVTVGSGVGQPITVDKVTNDLGTGLDGGGNEAADAVDLLFGQFIRNVPVSDGSFLERYFQFEAGWPNLYETEPPTPVANPDGFEYALDNLCNTLGINTPGQDKATFTANLVGTDTEPPVDNASRKTNASTPAEPVQTTAFNTSADFARLRIQDVDENGLTTDLTEMTTTLGNGVTPEKVLGVLGARFLNYGNFEVDIETVALFSSPLVIARIRSNTTVTMDWILENDDGVIGIDIPSMTLGNGGRDLPVNESVKVNLTGQAFLDPVLGTSIGVSTIPVIPTA